MRFIKFNQMLRLSLSIKACDRIHAKSASWWERSHHARTVSSSINGIHREYLSLPADAAYIILSNCFFLLPLKPIWTGWQEAWWRRWSGASPCASPVMTGVFGVGERTMLLYMKLVSLERWCICLGNLLFLHYFIVRQIHLHLVVFGWWVVCC